MTQPEGEGEDAAEEITGGLQEETNTCSSGGSFTYAVSGGTDYGEAWAQEWETALLKDLRFQVIFAADHLEKVAGMDRGAARLAAFEFVIFGKEDKYLRFREQK